MAKASTPSPRAYQVFVSSTYLDNKARRKVVEDTIIRAGMRPIGMERFTATTQLALESCLDLVRQAVVGNLTMRASAICVICVIRS